MMKHACVAARIGDGKALGAANVQNLRKTSNAVQRRFWLQPFGLARVLAQHFVASPLLRITKRRALLRVLSQNRDSALAFHSVMHSLVSNEYTPKPAAGAHPACR